MITRLSSPAAASFSADKHKSGSGFMYPNRFVNANPQSAYRQILGFAYRTIKYQYKFNFPKPY